MELVFTIITGAIAGWLASMIYKKGKIISKIGNIIIGILGSFLGNRILGDFGIHLGRDWIGIILTGTIGAIIILFLINLIFKKR